MAHDKRLSANNNNAIIMAEDSSNFIERMLELGIGMSMVQQIPGMLSGCMPAPNNGANMPSGVQQGVMPPPVTNGKVSSYIVADGSQAGPFTDEEMIKLIQNDLVKPETLVWQQGMKQWSPASQVPNIQKLFLLSKLK